MINAKEFIKRLRLRVLYRPEGDTFHIQGSDINRPGLQFSGYFEHFASERLQIIGRAEMEYYLRIPLEERTARIARFMAAKPPCVIICRGMPCPPEMLEMAQKYEVPLLRSRDVTTQLSSAAATYLNDLLAPQETIHGVLIEVYGVGILLTGNSGIGKSESALEMVKRGHRLVSDDAVVVKRLSDERLVGSAPANIEHYMEIRGLGLIDVQSMYGVGSVIPSAPIDFVIHLEIWNEQASYDRLDMGNDTAAIMDVAVPKITVPVRPGRNLAIILEVAALNFKLKNSGYDAIAELERRLAKSMTQG